MPWKLCKIKNERWSKPINLKNEIDFMKLPETYLTFTSKTSYLWSNNFTSEALSARNMLWADLIWSENISVKRISTARISFSPSLLEHNWSEIRPMNFIFWHIIAIMCQKYQNQVWRGAGQRDPYYISWVTFPYQLPPYQHQTFPSLWLRKQEFPTPADLEQKNHPDLPQARLDFLMIFD